MTQLAHLTLFALTVPTVSSVPCKFFFVNCRRIVSDISIILHFCCILAIANMLPPVRDKL